MKPGSRVVVSWLGVEQFGTLVERGKPFHKVKLDLDGIVVPCSNGSKFGRILEKETRQLQKGTYEMKAKTELEYIYGEISAMVNALGGKQDDFLAGKPKAGVELRRHVKKMKDKLEEYRKESLK